MQDSRRFYGFALALQLCIFVVGEVPGLRLGSVRPAAKETVGRGIAAVIAAIPIAVPTVVLSANAACSQRLRQSGIDLLDPAKLKMLADVSVVCFDKTGTLTGSVVSMLLLH